MVSFLDYAIETSRGYKSKRLFIKTIVAAFIMAIIISAIMYYARGNRINNTTVPNTTNGPTKSLNRT